MNTEWVECVRWCHANEDEEIIESHIESLIDLSLRSSYSTPILTNTRDEAGFRVAGYVVLYPGALASIGNLRSDSSENEELDRTGLANMAKELFAAAFDHGAEMVQAISPLIATRISSDLVSAFISPEPQRDLVLKESGMIPMAKLVQMECIGLENIPRLAISEVAMKSGEICFTPHHQNELKHWGQLVESTYVETLDVPELNGLRNIESTLAGYASAIAGIPQSWWVVRCNDVEIGCLLLTPTAVGCCELTYVGIKPEWRGKGLSKIIMNFVRDWALTNTPLGITLAVDLRNLPAIRLYQASGFVTQRFVQAWVCFPIAAPS